MTASTNWRIVVIAIVVALVPVGVSLAAVYYPRTTATDAPVIEVSAFRTAFPTNGADEWRAALGSIATPIATSTKDFRAPVELGTTDSLAQELVAAYVTLKSENAYGTQTGKDLIAQVVKRNVTVVQPNDRYELASVRVDPAMTLEQYAEKLGAIIDRSTSIREYELTAFARAVHGNDTNGTPSLQATARVYRTIEHDLAATPVPAGMASAHLEMIQSIAFLAQSVELMGDWSGDPIDAMSYMDAFVRADRQTKVSFDNLFATVIKLNKQP